MIEGVVPMLLLLVAAVLAVLWNGALRARERANEVAMETCKQLNVQLLDGTVAFASMRPTRDADGNIGWRRSYVFDYTEDGMNRLQGFVVLQGSEIEAVGLAPGRHHVN